MQLLFLDVIRLSFFLQKNGRLPSLILLFDVVAHNGGLPLARERPGGFVGVEAFDDLASADNVKARDSGLGKRNCKHLEILSALLGLASWAPPCALSLSI